MTIHINIPIGCICRWKSNYRTITVTTTTRSQPQLPYDHSHNYHTITVTTTTRSRPQLPHDHGHNYHTITATTTIRSRSQLPNDHGHNYPMKHISGVMIRVLTLSVIDHVYEHRSGKTKHYKIGICICCFSTKCTVLTSKSEDSWLEIRVMCSYGATCLPTHCCFGELAL